MSESERAELMALADLRRANVARQKEWDAFGQLTLAYRGNELAGEVGEACNIIKKLERERLGIKGSRDTVEHLAEELADIIICTDLIAMQANIDLGRAVIAKFNASSEKVGLVTRLAAVPMGNVREALERELNDCQGAIDTIEHHRDPNNETQNGNYRFYQGRVVSLKFAIDALVPAGGVGNVWQHIDTAPKSDGTRVDLYLHSSTSGERWTVRDCIWTGSRWEHNNADIQGTPTHWCAINSLTPPTALAPQNAGGERHKSSDGGVKEAPASNPDYNGVKSPALVTAHGLSGQSCPLNSVTPSPSEATPAPAIPGVTENHKAALPVATVINDNQPGRTAIIEITIDPPTLPVGTKLYAGPKMVELHPAPAEDAAVAWQKRAVWSPHPDWSECDADSCGFWREEGYEVRPLFTRPAVDVEAVRDVRWLVSSARAFLRHFNPCNLAEDKSQQWQSLSHQCDVVERALLRDSNAASDKGGR